MAPIPPPTDTTIARIYKAWEAKQSQHHRTHLGASRIGRECERELWYEFRWAKKPSFNGRMLRLFARGQSEEAVIVSDLRMAGVEVHDHDDNGKQFQFTDHAGHFAGSMDGCGRGFVEAPEAWHVLEFKTHNDKSFAALEKDGVQRAKPEHYAQMQTYMGWSGMRRAAYFAINKNTDDIYMERVPYDSKEFEKLRAKAKSIIFSDTPPARINESPAFYKCKLCAMASVCHGYELPEVNCRTCKHAHALEDGGWGCSLLQKPLTQRDQETGCADHAFINEILPESMQALGQVDITSNAS